MDLHNFISNHLYQSVTPQSYICTITPQNALWIIENCNGGNRALAPQTIASYKRQMQEGLWKLNGESIIFGNDGKLKNGFHRMFACINAKVPFQSVVVVGIDANTFPLMDGGHLRTLKDVVSIYNSEHGIKAYTDENLSDKKKDELNGRMASDIGKITKMMMMVEMQMPTEHGASSTRKVPNNGEILAYYLDNNEIVNETRKFWVEINKLPSLKGNTFRQKNYFGGLIAYLLKNGVPYDKVTTFFNVLFSANYGSNFATRNLRDYMLAHATRKFKPMEIWNIYTSAWNAYFTNKETRLDKRTYRNDGQPIMPICSL